MISGTKSESIGLWSIGVWDASILVVLSSSQCFKTFDLSRASVFNSCSNSRPAVGDGGAGREVGLLRGDFGNQKILQPVSTTGNAFCDPLSFICPFVSRISHEVP
jgi:hypothetical protein